MTKEELLGFLSDKIAKWWLPDDVVFVDELPHTATGKVLKTKLRQEYAGWLERPLQGAFGGDDGFRCAQPILRRTP